MHESRLSATLQIGTLAERWWNCRHDD